MADQLITPQADLRALAGRYREAAPAEEGPLRRQMHLRRAEKLEAYATLIDTLTADLDAEKARADALQAERDEFERQIPRFPDHMARIVEAKNAGLPDRLKGLVAAIEAIPEHMRQYQWQADEKQRFGSKWVRAVAGDNGKGMGRQLIAEVVGHIDVADFVAAANPDTVAMLLTSLAAELEKVARLTEAIGIAAEQSTLAEWQELVGAGQTDLGDKSQDWHAGYDAAIKAARAALDAGLPTAADVRGILAPEDRAHG